MEAGATKQVRVDNWGVFFLQRLQLFFSKTDFCDLTLQFEGNVQLKVHRLVMNACTEYFTFLEQTRPTMEENTILMPSDMQADVIVPIVNFMYTGMLEFHYSVFDRIYKAAEVMNITVLLKILEAQVATRPIPPSVSAKKKEITNAYANTKRNSQKTSTDFSCNKKPVPWNKRRTTSSTVHPVSATFNEKWSSTVGPQDPLSLPDNTPKPTRFEWPEDELPTINLMDISFDEISYTSKPLMTREEEERAAPSFDEIRNSSRTNRKKSSISESSSNMNMQEAEDYVKEQKVRTDQNLHEQEEAVTVQSTKRKLTEQQYNSRNTSSQKRAKISDKDNKEAATTTLNVKSNAASELDTTKIVSEILKKYPGLVKKNKNIKLKIMASPSKSSNVEQNKSTSTTSKKVKAQASPPDKKEIKTEPVTTQAEVKKVSEDGPWSCDKCNYGETPEFVLYYLFRKHMSDVHGEVFDGRYCKYCGKFCSAEVIMAYHLYTKHGVKAPQTSPFPKCEQCPFIAISQQRMLQHKELHNSDEAQCFNCKLGFLSKQHLNAHVQLSGHLNQNKVTVFDCAYCMKKFQSSVSLFHHTKTLHFKEARRDGMVCLGESMDVDDIQIEEDKDLQNHHPDKHEEDEEEEESEYILPVNVTQIAKKSRQIQKDKVKIISDVKVPSQQEEDDDEENSQPQRQLDPSSEAEALNNVASGIATSLGLVDIVVLDDNQQYILQQQQTQNETEFILPELSSRGGMLQTSGQDINSTDELVMVLADQDYPDGQSQENSENSNIVVLYSHPVDGQEGQFITSQGNLLVNSETGMLEIRNGTTIGTTTSSQAMSVSESHDSPAESIEMIQREIDSHANQDDVIVRNNEEPIEQGSAQEDHSKDNLPEDNEIHEYDEETHNQLSQSSTYGDSENALTSADVTDSTEDHEAMDVEHDASIMVHVTAENVSETNETDAGLVQNATTGTPSEAGQAGDSEVAQTIESEVGPTMNSGVGYTMDSEVGHSEVGHTMDSEVEQTTDEVTQTTHAATTSVDVPPASPLYAQGGNTVILNDEEHVKVGGSAVILNDLTGGGEENVCNTGDLTGGGGGGEEEENVCNTGDSLILPSGGDILSHDNLQDLHIASEYEPEPMEVDGVAHVENNEQDMGANEGEVTIHHADEETTTEQPEETLPSNEGQNEEETFKQTQQTEERMQEDIRVEDIPLPPEELRPPNSPSTAADGPNSDSHDLQSQTDVQTGEGEESHSSQEPERQEQVNHEETRASAELNRTILEDWDDTDSQQSPTEKQKSTVNKEAVDNVNKLMDDWDEEEEDDKHKE